MAYRQLGDILVAQGAVGRDDIQAALRAQQADGHKSRLGDLLIESGKITSAALAAAADTATPMTLRKVSTGIVFATAHGADNSDLDHWAALAGSGLTLALYMGKSIAAPVGSKLIARGLDATTPVGIVVNAGRRDASFHAGSLGDLAVGTADFAEGPAIIFIGAAVAAGDWQQAARLAAREFKVA